MSYYTQVEFVLNRDKNISSIRKHLCNMWEASSVTSTGRFVGRNSEYEVYEITISELDLPESTPILQTLKSKFGLMFTVKYGVI